MVSRDQLRSALTVIVMLLFTEAVYLRPGILLGRDSLVGSDYDMLHRWRLGFARQALFGPGHSLPGWNPHEVLGAPFAANLQGFPWIPTRLILLLFDPSVAYGVGVAIAAALAAGFAYLYCRRIGLSLVGSAAAGWTFASAGFFSSRVMAGHLPLLEAYPALPLLLWLVDRALDGGRQRRLRFDLGVLALCCACVVVAGHPQVPAYALASAFVYVAWKRPATQVNARIRVVVAMMLGIGLSLAAWWPMLKLIGRSTRVLHLAAPDNDVGMAYSRLLALVVPGIQGWADPVTLADAHPFDGFPNNSFFWDTASYIGLLPLIALAWQLIRCVIRKRMPEGRFLYLAVIGVGALVCALPLANPLLHALPGTFLRSPARLLYVSSFCAAVGLGVGVDAFRSINWPREGYRKPAVWVLAVLLAAHFADLCWFDHWFIQTYSAQQDPLQFQATLDRELGSGRIAQEREDTVFSYGDRYDDAGGFDSIFLARFNQGYMALAGRPADTNEQVFDASVLPVKALQALGVRFAVTTEKRSDLPLAASTDEAQLYRVENPAPRADFFSLRQVEFAPEEKIPALFASGSWNRLILGEKDRGNLLSGGSGDVTGPPTAEYSRPSTDEIVVRVASPEPGYVRLLESYDPGWSATEDGRAGSVVPANGFEMAVPVGAGRHVVRFRYETPGRTTGTVLSLASLGLLAVLLVRTRTDAK